MKISLALLILLLAAAWTGSQGMSFHSSGGKCCSKDKFYHKKIPESKILGYQYTPSSCTYKAVLVRLELGSVCVDPRRRWFRDYQKQQNESNSIST